MKSIHDLNLVPVWVNPQHWVASARILMKGHALRAIPVVEGETVIGVVTMDGIEGLSDQTPCHSALKRSSLTVSPTSGIVQVAQSIVDADVDHAIVMDGGKLVGLVTSNMLLRELRLSWDPLTGLGWSDRIREWGMQRLANGQEVTVVFVDLDKFGQYNKQHGHIVGDRVLRRVAQMLKDSIDPARDILVRYGGDEFAIASTRTRPEAEGLARMIQERSGTLFADDAYRPVTFSVGVSGGRRTNPRPDSHVSSMFDELLNSASRDCLANKRKTEEFA